jgi:hypothetical protein
MHACAMCTCVCMLTNFACMYVYVCLHVYMCVWVCMYVYASVPHNVHACVCVMCIPLHPPVQTAWSASHKMKFAQDMLYVLTNLSAFPSVCMYLCTYYLNPCVCLCVVNAIRTFNCLYTHMLAGIDVYARAHVCVQVQHRHHISKCGIMLWRSKL